MKKISYILVLAVLFCTPALTAESGHRDDDSSKHAKITKVKMNGMMGGKQQLVATPDGGVIVLTGHTLYKYDQNLNLVKEVELPKDKKGGCCPLHDKKSVSISESEPAHAEETDGSNP